MVLVSDTKNKIDGQGGKKEKEKKIYNKNTNATSKYTPTRCNIPWPLPNARGL